MQGYVRYILKNTDPVRIADDSTSQSGQTNCLRYIPGTTMRGLIINGLARENDFPQIKKQLFSDEVRYLNAYLMENGRELLPSPKGFYEDKSIHDGAKQIQNVVVSGDFTEGYKRAQLGRYCCFDKDCITYYSVLAGSDRKIKMNLRDKEKQNIFRNEYLAAGQEFCGYIAVNDKELAKRIMGVLEKPVVIGNGRSAGLGKCRVLSCGYVDSLPYGEYMPQHDLENFCYLMLLSNTVMRGADGEYCGLDLQALGDKLGVKGLAVEYCATSTVEVKGHNRIWGTKTPSVVMYEQGSVFHFRFSGTMKKEKIQELSDEGVGIRRNEGFGRVLFLEHYEDIKYKQAGVRTKRPVICDRPLSKEDEEVLRIAAHAYYTKQLRRAMTQYIAENPLARSKVSNNRLGIIESFASSFRYEPEEGFRSLREYLAHVEEKEDEFKIQKEKKSIKKIRETINKILDTPIGEFLKMDEQKGTAMGIPKKKLLPEQEEKQMKLELISKLIRYEYKRG